MRRAYRLLFSQEGTHAERIADVSELFIDIEPVLEILEFFFQENVPPEAGSNFGEMESFLQERALPEDSNSSKSSDSGSSDLEKSDSEKSDPESTFKFLDFIKWN